MKFYKLGKAMALSALALAVHNANAQDNLQAELDALKAQVEKLASQQSTMNEKSIDLEDSIEFNGFYSVGISKMNREGYTYETGQENDTDTLPNTLVGLQMTANLYDGGSFVTQMIAKGYREGQDAFEPEVEWLYWKHDLGAGFTATAGRIRFPLFMESGNYDVGYSYPWVTPPTDVYGVLELTNIDGAALNYTTNVGDWGMGAQVIWGNADLNLPQGDAALKDVYGLVLTTETDDLSFRLAYMNGQQTWDSTLDLGFFSGPVLLQFEDDLEYLVESVKYDNGTIYFSAEAIQVSADQGVLPEDNSWNTTLGWRFGAFMPYIGYSQTSTDNGDELAANINAQMTANGLNPDHIVAAIPGTPPIPVATTTSGDIAQAVFNEEQTTVTLGLRWDFAPKTAIKFQVQSLNGFDGTIGNFTDSAAGDARPDQDILDFDDALIYDIAIQGVF